jgi:CTP synthase (UTP-ammonia lyase)
LVIKGTWLKGVLPLKIALIGDYNKSVTAHEAIPQALTLSAQKLRATFDYDWIPTQSIETEVIQNQLKEYNGFWITPASPYKSMDGALKAIQFARENHLPLLGTCGGFQHMVIEFAKNVLKMKDAGHAEIHPSSSQMIIKPLECFVSEQIHSFHLEQGTKIYDVYQQSKIDEQYGICNYGFNQFYADMFEKRGFIASGTDTEGKVKIMELTAHPFYIGTLFQPERSALTGKTHPLITCFIKACLENQ